jgi:hypothetical protein
MFKNATAITIWQEWIISSTGPTLVYALLQRLNEQHRKIKESSKKA